MKRIITLVLLLFVLSLCSVASAKPHHHNGHGPHYHNGQGPRHHDWSHPAYRHQRWQHYEHGPLPFKWYQHRRHYAPRDYRMESINDWEWHDRFPGLRAYKWRDHGPGFWYHGRRIRDAVLFYNDDDELVSCGFMHNGLFVFMRDDDRGYESDDSFFLGWWSHW